MRLSFWVLAASLVAVTWGDAIRGKSGLTWMSGVYLSTTSTDDARNYVDFGQFGAGTPASRYLAPVYSNPGGDLMWTFSGASVPASDDLWAFSFSRRRWAWLAGATPGTYNAGMLPSAPVVGMCYLRHGPSARLNALLVSEPGDKTVWLYGGYSDDTSYYFDDLWSFSNETGWCARRALSGFNTVNTYGGCSACGQGSAGVNDATTWPFFATSLFYGAVASTRSVSNGFYLWSPSGSNSRWLRFSYDHAAAQYNFTWVVAGGLSGNLNCWTGNTATPGARGVPGIMNCPGTRQRPMIWAEEQTPIIYLWGDSDASPGNNVHRADLWAFNTTSTYWTYLGGSVTFADYLGSYTPPYWPSGSRWPCVASLMAGVSVLSYGQGWARGGDPGGLDQIWRLDARDWSNVTWLLVGGTADQVFVTGDVVGFQQPPDYQSVAGSTYETLPAAAGFGTFWDLTMFNAWNVQTNRLSMHTGVVISVGSAPVTLRASQESPIDVVILYRLFDEIPYTIDGAFNCSLSLAPSAYSGSLLGRTIGPVTSGLARFSGLALNSSGTAFLRATSYVYGLPFSVDLPPIVVSCALGCATCTDDGLSWPDKCTTCDVAAGYFVNPGLTACTSTCPVGYFINDFSAGFRVCVACTTGCAICSNFGLAVTTCNACDEAAGYTRALVTGTCTNACGATEFNNVTVSPHRCQACAVGCVACTDATNYCTCDSANGYAVTASGQCVLGCPAGQIKDGASGALTCTAATCPPNTAGGALLDVACVATNYTYGAVCLAQCPTGTTGRNAVIECIQSGVNVPPSWNDSTSCVACKPNTYASADKTSCTPCVNGITLAPNAASPRDCVCLANYATAANGDCVPCPYGASCAGAGVAPIAADGFFFTTNSLYVPCFPQSACASNNTCNDGYTGYLCTQCTLGHYRIQNECQRCPETSTVKIVLALLVGIVISPLLIFVADAAPIGEVGIAITSPSTIITFVQTVALVGGINIYWPRAALNISYAFSSLNFNIALVSPECIAPFGFYDKFVTIFVIPFVILASFVAAFGALVAYTLKRRSKETLIRDAIKLQAMRAAAGFLFFLVLIYIPLCQNTLAIFSCVGQADGRIVLSSSLGDECYSDSWRRLMPLGVIGIIIYIIGIPLAALLLFGRSLRSGGLRVATAHPMTNFLVFKFKGNFWYWELIILTRKLIIVVAVTFGGTPTVQSVAVCMVLFLATLFTAIFRPYNWSKQTLAEVVSNGATVLIIGCGLSNGTESTAQSADSALGATVVAIAALTLIALFILLILEIWLTYVLYRDKKRLDRDYVPVDGHSSSIVALAPYGDVLYSAGRDKLLVRWTRNEVSFIKAETLQLEFTSPLTSMAVLESGLLVVGDAAGAVTVVDEKLSVLSTFVTASGDAVLSVVADDRYFITGHASGRVRVWLAADGGRGVDHVTDAQVNDSGAACTQLRRLRSNNIMAGSRSGVSIYRIIQEGSEAIASLEKLGQYSYRKDAELYVDLSLARNAVCIATGRGHAQLLNVHSGQTMASLPRHWEGISAMLVSGDHVLTGARDGTLRFWTADQAGTLVSSTRPHRESVVALAVHGKNVLAGYADGHIAMIVVKKSNGLQLENDVIDRGVSALLSRMTVSVRPLMQQDFQRGRAQSIGSAATTDVPLQTMKETQV